MTKEELEEIDEYLLDLYSMRDAYSSAKIIENVRGKIKDVFIIEHITPPFDIDTSMLKEGEDLYIDPNNEGNLISRK